MRIQLARRQVSIGGFNDPGSGWPLRHASLGNGWPLIPLSPNTTCGVFASIVTAYIQRPSSSDHKVGFSSLVGVDAT